MNNKVDLPTAKKGDILITKQGSILEFLEHLPEEHYYDCRVKYLTFVNEEGVLFNEKQLGEGTRFYDGSAFKNKKLDTDQDVIVVYDRRTFKKLIK